MTSDIKKEEILTAFNSWKNALTTGDPKMVASHYHPNAILLPTLSNIVRHTPEELEDYFDFFLSRDPKAEVESSYIRTYDNIATHSGIYAFVFGDGTSARTRFTFVYKWHAGQWLIIEHHSSQMPEQQEITKISTTQFSHI